MIIYNTTYHIHSQSDTEFIDWIKSRYIPIAIESGLLASPQLALIMSDKKDEGLSYSLQFKVESMDILEKWYKETGLGLVKELETKFSNHIAGFSTLMSLIDIKE